MTARDSSPRCRRWRREDRPVEAAGPVDAKSAPTRSLENAQIAFSTAPTGLNKLLPMYLD